MCVLLTNRSKSHVHMQVVIDKDAVTDLEQVYIMKWENRHYVTCKIEKILLKKYILCDFAHITDLDIHLL
jgi:hypothetical protein